MNELFYILPLLSIGISIIALIISFSNFKKRMLLEGKLRDYLIEEIRNKKLDLKELKTRFDGSHIEIKVFSRINEKEIESYQKELDECVIRAMERLMDNEKKIIKRAIDNSIQDGRSRYKDKVINDTVSKALKIKVA